MSDPGTSNWWTDPDAAIARIEQQVAEAQEKAVVAQQLQEQLTALRGRASSRRGEVTAVVEVGGRLSDLRLTAEALDLDPDALARLVVDTVGAAHRSAGAAALDLTSAAFGEDSGTTQHLRDELARLAPGSAASGITDLQA